jgi:hypothetical protein
MKISGTSLALFALGLGLAVSAAAADVAGKWTATFDTQVGEQRYTYEFKTDGDKFTGTAKSNLGQGVIQDGLVKGDEVSFVEMLEFQGQTLRIEYRGKISGDEMRLTRHVGDVATEELVAKRAQ